MLLLVFESIGTQELALIVIAALMLFGPRKLPELGRMFGKSLAEFRRASEDFKRTWQMEVELEQAEKQRPSPETAAVTDSPIVTDASHDSAAHTTAAHTAAAHTAAPPPLVATPAESIVARGRANSIGDPATNADDPPATITFTDVPQTPSSASSSSRTAQANAPESA